MKIGKDIFLEQEGRLKEANGPGHLDDTLHQEWEVLEMKQRAKGLASEEWHTVGEMGDRGVWEPVQLSQLTVSLQGVLAVLVSFEFFHLVAKEALGRGICCMANTSVSN